MDTNVKSVCPNLMTEIQPRDTETSLTLVAAGRWTEEVGGASADFVFVEPGPAGEVRLVVGVGGGGGGGSARLLGRGIAGFC